MRKLSLMILTGLLVAPYLSAQPVVAPQTPALEISEVTEVAATPAPVAQAPVAEAAPAPAPAKKKTRRSSRKKKAAKPDLTGTVAPEAKKALDAQAEVSVVAAEAPAPVAPAGGEAKKAEIEADAAIALENTDNTPTEGTVTPREPVAEAAQPVEAPRVVYNPITRRDPTLSPDDLLLLEYREKQRLAAIEAERQRKLAEEKRAREEAERLRQLELARLKDPSREIRGLIHIGGIIGQEVFIGDKVYTVGNSIYGAKIVEVHHDKVVFSYKGHRFVRKMK